MHKNLMLSMYYNVSFVVGDVVIGKIKCSVQEVLADGGVEIKLWCCLFLMVYTVQSRMPRFSIG